ncbi:SAM-dependent methyltransferase [Tamlana sp. s12]|nr:SAM-dependent methyltransferase [Tamlana sp. s12]
MTKKNKQPWPTKAVMDQIYECHLWGGNDHDFYSGSGSHDPEITTPYLNAVTHFLKTHKNDLIVCDLGCGDFNIGKQLLPFTKHYNAIDIVENLINRNKKLYPSEKVSFQCLDISKDALPPADCIILRQVLQHLSNTEIQNILKKLYDYKYIILTEHLPSGNFTPNTDIISGQGIRIKKNSGVDILAAPFHFKVKEIKLLGKQILNDGKGCLVTMLFTLF